MENKEIILVVDDNPELLDGLKTILEMEGYQALTAINGQDALQILERITPDLILADIMMPKMDGYELYEKVHADERWVQVPFIFLTAKTDQTDIRRGKEMGIDDYITKPFEPEDLLAAIRGRLHRMAEVTGRPGRADVLGNIKYAWHGKLGPLPVPVITLAVVAAMIMTSGLLFTMFGSAKAAELEPATQLLRGDVGESVLIPAGPFTMGGNGANALTAQTIFLPDYHIDIYEVTYRAFDQFSKETQSETGAYISTYPAAQANHPVTGVTWAEANAFCQWAGKRLPTEAEWEKAARSDDGRAFPWGNEWRSDHSNTRASGLQRTSPVGSYSLGASPYGIHDLAGNVWEWVADWQDADQKTKVIRGGAWNAIESWAEASARNTASPTATQNNLGFRCAYSK